VARFTLSRNALREVLWLAAFIVVDQTNKASSASPWLNQAASPFIMVLGVGALLLLVIVWVKTSAQPSLFLYALLAIIAGGLSNLADRLAWGGVRDTLVIGTLAFNIADLSIIGGSLALLYYLGRGALQGRPG
jgi:lipoprotein signal peptidase